MTQPQEKPKILGFSDFLDAVNYCFYLLGYTDGVRGAVSVVIEPDRMAAYNKGTKDGLNYVNWLFEQSINTKN